MKTTKAVSEHRTPKNSRAQAGEVSAPQADNALSRRIAAGPVMAAQRKVMEQMNSPIEPVQRQSPEEEELLQGRFATQLQSDEDDELLQGAFDTGGSATVAGDVE
jgi:hypothetical protein